MPRPISKIKVGITMGDPSGIGPEIIALALKKVRDNARFVIIGDKRVFQKAKARDSGLGKHKFIDLANVNQRIFSFGRIKAEYGRASIEYLGHALELIKDKELDCLVTGPISKESINKAGFKFPGHTEYLVRQTQSKNFAMMLLNNRLKISLVTRHIPIAGVPCALKKEDLCITIRLTHQALKNLFLINRPRIVICGLNPHASDNGLIGGEENEIIRPALSIIRKSLPNIYGPLPADIAIARTVQGSYDCAIAMYHDQALIPLKLTSAESGVNITLGLPFVRTSPLHGTAFDIAGKALASPDSLIAAINLAIACSMNLKFRGLMKKPAHLK
ncbi:MAG: 4-hydroxythreonine-4-phosphate dehydrogenase PdxA [Candidatus Omnitrophica bacterium]|nr:4-hydroxythreonine-4-phosphate dehydrogenase PdxA [Candidatus Omnitrophota bacterium]